MRPLTPLCLLLAWAPPAMAQPASDPAVIQSQQERSDAYRKERGDYDLQVRVMAFAVGCKVIGEQEAVQPVVQAGAMLRSESKRLGIPDDVDALTKTGEAAGTARAGQPNACHYWHDHPDAVAFVQAHVTHTPR